MSWQDRPYSQRPVSGGGSMFANHPVSGSVVMWLLIINAGVFLLDGVLSGGMRTPWWLKPSVVGNFNVEQAVFKFQIWRFFTYQFLHGGFLHVLVNMIGLYFFGPLIERWWGSRRFLAFYLICGMSATVFYTLLVLAAPGVIFNVAAMSQIGLRPVNVPLIGASGSIFGILVATAMLYPNLRVMLIFPPIPMSMRTMALLFLGIAVLSLITGTRNAGGEAAHLGGAVLGFVLVRNPRLLNWADETWWKLKRGKGAWQRRQKAQVDHEAEIDRILAKVKAHGLHSLTRRERKALQNATDRQRRAG